MSAPRIAFVLGRAPGEGSVLPEIVARLGAAGVRVSVDTLSADDAWPAHTMRADLVVPRALDVPALVRARRLVAAGVPCCNTIAATELARRKDRAAAALVRAGVPSPPTRVCRSWAALRRWAANEAVAVKPVAGSRGDRVTFFGPGVAAEPPFPGPWLVQRRVDGDGWDRKLYVVGDAVTGLLRRWPPRSLAAKLGRPLAVDAALADLARAAAAALDLHLCGVDVVVDVAGPMVVDVNALPGFKGAPRATALITEHLLAHLRQERREVAPCTS